MGLIKVEDGLPGLFLLFGEGLEGLLVIPVRTEKDFSYAALKAAL